LGINEQNCQKQGPVNKLVNKKIWVKTKISAKKKITVRINDNICINIHQAFIFVN